MSEIMTTIQSQAVHFNVKLSFLDIRPAADTFTFVGLTWGLSSKASLFQRHAKLIPFVCR